MDNKPPQLFPFSDAIVLGIVSCYAYALAFVYEWGWVSHHNLPTYLIQVSISSIFITLAALIVVVVAMIGISMVVPFGIKHYLGGLSAVLMLLLFGAAVVAVLKRDPLQHWALIFSLLLFVGLLAMIVAAIRTNMKEGQRWWNWLRATPEPNYLPTTPDDHTLYTTFLQHLADRGVNIFYVSLGFVVSLHFLNVTYNKGRSDARLPHHLMVSRADSAITLLRVIGDRAILGHQTIRDGTVITDYRIVSPAELSQHDWMIREVPPKAVSSADP